MAQEGSTQNYESKSGSADDAIETLTSFFLDNGDSVSPEVSKAFNIVRKSYKNVNNKGDFNKKMNKDPMFKPFAKYYIIGPNHKCVHLHGAKDGNGAKISQWDKVNQDNLK